MKDTFEYQIFIGCRDSQSKRELVTLEELIDGVKIYFEQEKIDFSIFRATGGYRHEGGWYVTENSLCINIIGPSNVDIMKLAKSISMIMNQEYSLVIRKPIEVKFG